MADTAESIKAFEPAVRSAFLFLDNCSGFQYTGIKMFGENDPRDAAIVAQYRRPDAKIDISWSESQKLVSILIKPMHVDVPTKIKYLYLDSFVEFISDGKELPIIAQIYPRTISANIFKVIKKREELFKATTVENVVKLLADRLNKYFKAIQEVSPVQLRQYHDWMLSKHS